MNVQIDPDSHICLVCGRVADYHEGLGWRHSLQDTWHGDVDHPLIAVRRDLAPDQVRPRCDFCSADNPTHFLPVRPFQHLAGMSADDWAACETCAKALEQNRWNELMRRAIAQFEAVAGETIDPLVVAALKDMHRRLRKNIYGPLQRLEDR